MASKFFKYYFVHIFYFCLSIYLKTVPRLLWVSWARNSVFWIHYLLIFLILINHLLIVSFFISASNKLHLQSTIGHGNGYHTALVFLITKELISFPRKPITGNIHKLVTIPFLIMYNKSKSGHFFYVKEYLNTGVTQVLRFCDYGRWWEKRMTDCQNCCTWRAESDAKIYGMIQKFALYYRKFLLT